MSHYCWKCDRDLAIITATLSFLLTASLLTGCKAPDHRIFQYDNGDDYLCEGVRRIVDKDGRMGFADEKGDVVVSPRFAFVFPFENGVAKATCKGRSVAEGEHQRWVSPEWFYIDHSGNVITREPRYAQLEERLKRYVAGKDARVGIGVIIEGKDTVEVNGRSFFPMMSVFKFPQALAVADHCMKLGAKPSDSIAIKAEEIKENTWSPLREKYGVRDLRLPLSELLDFTLQQSDNNACDILFRLIGGPAVADSVMKSIGYDEIEIIHTEDEMHRDTELSYRNRATPIEMARLFDHFYRGGMCRENPFHELIGKSMMTCATGLDRLPAPLMPTNATIGHKTGTGDRNSEGRIIAINDAGQVFLPNKKSYSIAVFVENSALDMAETAKIIAEISRIVYESID